MRQNKAMRKRRTSRPPSIGWRLGRVVASVFAPILLLCAMAMGLGYFRLSQGPVSLNFLAKPFEEGINAELDGLIASVEDVVMSWSKRGGVEFQLRNVRLMEPGGEPILSAPSTAVELSLPAMLQLRAVPSRVELIEPSLLVHYSDNAGLSLRIQTSKRGGQADGGDGRRSNAAPNPGRVNGGQATTHGDVIAVRDFDLSQVVEQAMAKARQGLDAAGNLSQLGLRDATVEFRYGARTSVWKVPLLEINRDHQAGSALAYSGGLSVETDHGLATASFTAREKAGTDQIALQSSVRNLVPSAMARALPLPQLSLLRTFDVPVDGDAVFTISKRSEFLDGELGLLIRRGQVHLPAQARTLAPDPIVIDSGRMNFVYDARRKLLTIAPSTLRRGKSYITLVGAVAGRQSVSGKHIWRYDITANDGVLASEEYGIAGIAVEGLEAKGRVVPGEGLLDLEMFRLAAGGSSITIEGEIDSRSVIGGARLETKVAPMAFATALAMWPRALAPGARRWLGENVRSAQVKSGQIRFYSGRYYEGRTASNDDNDFRLSLAFESEAVRANVMEGLPLVAAPRVLTRLENEGLEINIPTAELVLEGGSNIALKSGRFVSPDVYLAAPVGEVSFVADTTLQPVLAMLRAPGLALLDDTSMSFGDMSGKVNGNMKIRLPLLLNVRRADAVLKGKMRITDGEVRGLFGKHDAKSADIEVDVSDKALDFSGRMLVGGVLAKLNWQKIFDAPEQLQPPIRLTAKLDNADRTQLGLDVNHFVQGDVPVELTMAPRQGSERIVHLRADLTNAKMLLQGVAWQKPPGHSAFLEADIIESSSGTQLRNININGDRIRARGQGRTGKDGRMREFHFPVVSLNGIGEVDVRGRVGKGDVWKVKARGTAFDGRDFFRSLFSLGKLGEQSARPARPRGGIDLDATIDTVLGFEQLTLRGLEVKASKRRGKLTKLKGKGTLQGGRPLAFELRNTGRRVLLADSTDAGEAFKLIGFYPNLRGGRVRLEVNLDGQGAAEKTGILWVDDFDVLGDAIVSEVISSGGDGRPGSAAQRRRIKKQVTRQVFPFDRMKAPFSVGHGQFVLQDSYLRGPVLGASVRGKVDFRNSRVNLGGTYIPLQGLNNMLGGLPLIGAIVSGPRGEGIFGMTYAVQGSMQNPKVLVNPLSFVAPGIFREIFQMTPNDPRVQPRREGRRGDAGRRVRASSEPVSGSRRRARETTVDSWLSPTGGGR